MPNRTWAVIDTAALRANYRTLCTKAAPRTVMPIVKADAYGHGAVLVAQTLQDEGATIFGVATAAERDELRQSGVGAEIVVLGDSAPVHIKVDTGMTRLGVPWQRAAEVILQHKNTVQSVFTHYADPKNAVQRARWQTVCDAVRPFLPQTVQFHSAATNVILSGNIPPGDTMVRPGLALYISPDNGQLTVDNQDEDGRLALCAQSNSVSPNYPLSVMSVYTKILRVETVPAGEGVSYNHTYRTPTPRVIATLPIGYADGLPTATSGKLRFGVRGATAPQVGRICMDLCMLDVTDVPGVTVGDVVTVLGAGGAAAWEIADAFGGSVYEVLCNFGQRTKRVEHISC